MFNFEKCKHVYFIGIGGISMSSLAQILNHNNIKVSGSNNVVNEMTEKLTAQGIEVFIGHNKENIANDVDLVIYTPAISDDNEELVKAREMGVQIERRDILLGGMIEEYDIPIAVSGTHGKTTTSSMIAEIFLAANTNPTISIGGVMHSLDSNTHCGDRKYFIFEACEYKDSFLSFAPKIAAILNIDKDHLDYFKDLDAIRASFKKFAEKLPEDGTLIINNNIPALSEITKDLSCNIITYGNMSSDVKAENIVYSPEGMASFDVNYKGNVVVNITLNVPGYHNVSNALAAITAGIISKIDIDSIKKGIESFTGTERRLEFKGEFNGAKLYDDYAHHPTEIKASISTLKAMQKNKLHVIFQSHTYTRTKALLQEFATSLADADNIIITDIYAAREENTVNVHPEDLIELIKEINPNVTFISKFEDIAKHIKQIVQTGDIVATIGAGDIDKVCPMILK